MKNKGGRPKIQEMNQELCKEIQNNGSYEAKRILIDNNLEVVERVLEKYKDHLTKEEIEDLRQDGFVLLLEEAERYFQTSRSFRSVFTEKFASLISKKITYLEKRMFLDEVDRMYLVNHFIRSDWEDKHQVFMEDTRCFLSSLISRLTEKEQKVLLYRFVYEMTLDDIGKCFGVGRERIRQIEAKALRKLRHQAICGRRGYEYFYDFLVMRDDPCITNIINVERGVCFTTKKLSSDQHPITTTYNETTIVSNDQQFPIWVPHLVRCNKWIGFGLRMTACYEKSYRCSDATLFIYPMGTKKLVTHINIQIVTNTRVLDKVTVSIPVEIVSDIKDLTIDAEREFVKGIFCAGIGLVLDHLTEEERSALMVTYSELTKIKENDDLEKFSAKLLELVKIINSK